MSRWRSLGMETPWVITFTLGESGVSERTALQEAAVRWQKILAAEGIGEDEAVGDFKKWRADKRR